jgi:tetratricopeptide (TPR) repeat protein
LKLAEEFDPSSYVGISSTRPAHLYHNRQYDQLIELCKKLIEIDANFYLGHLVLGLAYEQKGMYEEAIAAARKAIGIVPGKSGEATLGHIYATIGRRGEAFKLIEEFKAASGQTYVDSLHIAVIYAGLGDAEQTLAWLERAYQERSSAMIYLNTDPRYDWLRGHPKFKDLLKRIGFAA